MSNAYLIKQCGKAWKLYGFTGYIGKQRSYMLMNEYRTEAQARDAMKRFIGSELSAKAELVGVDLSGGYDG